MKEKRESYGMIHGGDYNPEQWLEYPEILEKDIEYFKKAHINEVSLGIFAWAVLEPEEGKYNFDWMEQMINRLYENGIYVMLATPTGARPKWMADKYPEVLRVDEYRRRNLFGRRHNHCYTSPVYREKTRQMNLELARRFASHPGVIAWHLSNEYGGDCHCPLCQGEFRKWLKEKYATVDELNRCWCTTFWSHNYQSFDQVESPSPIGETSLHGLNLDWKRFVTARTADFIRHEAQAVRDGGGTQPLTINMMYNYVGLDYWKLKDLVDVISWDSYPTWHKVPEEMTAMDTGMQHDYMRALKGRPFWLMESCPSATNWQGVSKLKKPGMLLAASLQAVAHGSNSVQYFQLRQSRGSSEMFHGAVIDHYGGDDTRVFAEVTKVGEALEALSVMSDSINIPKAAIVYDQENRWALEDAQGPRNKGLYYKESVQKSYSAFRKLGIDVDMIGMDAALEHYKIVAAPMLFLFRDGFADRVRDFVKKGGLFILTYWSGIVDEYDRAFLGGVPGGLMDVMGLRSTEIDALYDGEKNIVIPEDGNTLGISKEYVCNHLCSLVRTDSARTIMSYGSDFYKGTPAFTENRYGDGLAYYVCADMEQSFYDDACHALLRRSCPELIIEGIPAGIEVTKRYSAEKEYTIVQNFGRQDAGYEYLGDAGNVIYGSAEDGLIRPLETVVFEKNIS